MSIRERILNQLRQLGDTADEVAESLRERDCEGHTSEPDTCPVAVYLRDYVTPADGPDLHVDHDFIDAFKPSAGMGDHLWSLDLPEPVAEFVREFDGGAYPELYPGSKAV